MTPSVVLDSNSGTVSMLIWGQQHQMQHSNPCCKLSLYILIPLWLYMWVYFNIYSQYLFEFSKHKAVQICYACCSDLKNKKNCDTFLKTTFLLFICVWSQRCTMWCKDTKPEQSKSNMDWWIVFVFYLDQFLFVESQRMHSTHNVVCQVLNMEVDLSWYEQPSRGSHLDQSIFCRVSKMAKEYEAILQDHVTPDWKYYFFTINSMLTHCWTLFKICIICIVLPNTYMCTNSVQN